MKKIVYILSKPGFKREFWIIICVQNQLPIWFGKTIFCMLLLYWSSTLNDIFYIINLKYAHLTPIFRLHNIDLLCCTCPHKYKWIFCYEKPVFNVIFQAFWCTKIKNHLICFENNDNYVFRGWKFPTQHFIYI